MNLPTCPSWCIEDHEPARHRGADVEVITSSIFTDGRADLLRLSLSKSEGADGVLIFMEGDPLTLDQAQELAGSLLDLVKVARSA